jgi:hypothetical protein
MVDAALSFAPVLRLSSSLSCTCSCCLYFSRSDVEDGVFVIILFACSLFERGAVVHGMGDFVSERLSIELYLHNDLTVVTPRCPDHPCSEFISFDVDVRLHHCRNLFSEMENLQEYAQTAVELFDKFISYVDFDKRSFWRMNTFVLSPTDETVSFAAIAFNPVFWK